MLTSQVKLPTTTRILVYRADARFNQILDRVNPWI